MPIFLIFVILFAIWIKYETGKNSKIEAKSNAEFFERERQSNFTRKADISNLDYITIAIDKLPFIGNYEGITSFQSSHIMDNSVKNEILSCEKSIIALNSKKILNLSGLSNTDIKMQYGVANLQILIQYDENFSKLSRLLAKWGSLLFEVGELTAAEQVLSYGVSCKCDIEDIFINLAKIYRHNGNELGISDLVESCSCFDDLRRENIINQITSV
ncbi:MAG: hypothetical protein ACTTKP_07330 [Catonella sp.]|uniref:hypothetical protein n=1 Tax=Catonella sp. TaxID=2382125 RepID=UPI003F9F0D91